MRAPGVLASVLRDASSARIRLGKMDALNAWLSKNVGTEERRGEVRAIVESLEDLRWLSEDMLSEHLNLEAWALVSRARFLAAWRELKGEGAPAPSEEAPRRPPPPPPSPGTPRRASGSGSSSRRPHTAPASAPASRPPRRPRRRSARNRRRATPSRSASASRRTGKRSGGPRSSTASKTTARGALGRDGSVRLRRGQGCARGALGLLGLPRAHLRQVSRRLGIGRRHRAVSLVYI